jgi:hypothetical protein
VERRQTIPLKVVNQEILGKYEFVQDRFQKRRLLKERERERLERRTKIN